MSAFTKSRREDQFQEAMAPPRHNTAWVSTGNPEEAAGIEADSGIVRDQRIVCEPIILQGIPYDKRLIVMNSRAA